MVKFTKDIKSRRSQYYGEKYTDSETDPSYEEKPTEKQVVESFDPEEISPQEQSKDKPTKISAYRRELSNRKLPTKSKQKTAESAITDLSSAETTINSAVPQTSKSADSDDKQNKMQSNFTRDSTKRNLSDLGPDANERDARRHKRDIDTQEQHSIVEAESELQLSESSGTKLFDIESEDCCRDLIQKCKGDYFKCHCKR